MHLVDKGYTDANVLVNSRREHGVEIVCLVAQDPSWQTREKTSFDKRTFAVDWKRKVVTCRLRCTSTINATDWSLETIKETTGGVFIPLNRKAKGEENMISDLMNRSTP